MSRLHEARLGGRLATILRDLTEAAGAEPRT